MRRHRAWLKWSLAVVVLSFIAFFIPQRYMQPAVTVGAQPNEVIADVAGHELTVGEYQQAYYLQVQNYRSQFGGSMSEQLLQQLGVDQQVLTQMVDEQVAVLEAERHGITVSDDELAQQIFSMPGLQENGQFIGEERYTQLLQSQNPPMTKAQFEDNLRRGIVVGKLRATLTDWMAVSDDELARQYRERNEKVKLQVVALTADAFRDKVTVSDADVAARYESNKNDYKIGEQRKIKYLLLDREQARQKANVPATDIQRYYNDNIQQFQTPEQIRASHILLETAGKDEAKVRAQADDLLKQIRAGADFAALATKFSDYKGSKDKRGDLDYFSRGRMVPEFETAAFALQPGQVSDIVKSQYGFHIIKLVDKRPGSTRTLDEASAQITEQLKSQVADRQVADRARQLAESISTPEDLDKAAGQAGIPLQESGLFQRTDPIPGLGSASLVAERAFALGDGAVSGADSSARGPMIFYVSGKKDAYVPPIEEVREKVRQDLIRSRAAELSRTRAGEVAAALKSAPNFAAAAKAQGVEARDTELLIRGSALPEIGISPAVDKVAFALPVNGVSDPIATADGTVIVKVVERDDVTPEELAQGKETFRADLLNERRSRFFNAYMSKVKERLAIDIRSDVLQRVVAARQQL
jgi:peptidyl-prolyl cis-trans isomerase D